MKINRLIKTGPLPKGPSMDMGELPQYIPDSIVIWGCQANWLVSRWEVCQARQTPQASRLALAVAPGRRNREAGFLPAELDPAMVLITSG
ncbi:hypothetical protein [Nonomuraea sp. B19D2]|uniref:hypothetical protein n=1 Tax=Nonomuraea sp. B19D2 TaxID=3159561 RepID=UPI0032DA7B6E